MSVRTGVVIHEYTYRKLLVGVLLLLHELYSKNSSSQAWKLGDMKLPSQQNDGGRSFLLYIPTSAIYTYLGHVLGENHEDLALLCFHC